MDDTPRYEDADMEWLYSYMRQMWVTVRHRVLMTHIVGLLVPRRASSLRTLLHECYVIERFRQ
jgi:hypothetical protein